MSMYGKFPKVMKDGKSVEQLANPVVDCSKDIRITVQADANSVDINKMIERIEKGGMLPALKSGQPFYGDVSSFDGLADSLMKVQEAEHLFMTMSAKIRERFDNDPVKMIEFLSNEENRSEAEELGMVLPRIENTPPAPIPPAGVVSKPG